MSIYKQIFATASIFAIAASALVSPVASAAEGVTITGYSNSNPSYSLCIYGPGQTSANATLISSGTSSSNINANLPVAPLPNGSTYNIFVQNASNSCTNGSIAGVQVPFTVFPRHMTTVPVTFSGTPAVLAANGASSIVNQSPYLSSNSGNTTINLCLGKTDSVTLTFTDPDNDNLQQAAAPLNLPSGMTYASNTSGGTITYTLYPSSNNVSVLGTIAGTATFSVQEQANSYQTAVGAAKTADITFNVSNTCSNTSTTVVSSSSMMSSSSSAAAVATPVASSSAKAVVSVEAPEMNSGKGTSTVRTGGAY
jgi:hypothetical protein